MGIYTAPKIFMRLKAEGVPTSRKQLMYVVGAHGRSGLSRACATRSFGKKRASKADSDEDLGRRNFAADGPAKAWFMDITYAYTHHRWL